MGKPKLLKRLFTVAMVIVVCFAFFPQSNASKVNATAADSVKQLEQKIENSRKLQKEYTAKSSALGSDISKTKEKQTAISGQINATESLVEALDEKIKLLEQNIENESTKIADEEKQIQQGIEGFKSRLRAMYLSGNDSVASVLLGSTDFYDMLMRLELVKRVADHDNKVIDDLIALKKQYEATKAQFESDKASLENTKKDHQGNLDSLNNLYDQNDDMIKQKEALKQQLANMSAAEKKAEDAAEKEIARIIYEEQLKNNAVFNGNFIWPVPSSKYISSPYGPRWGSFHKGIDISGASVFNKPIVASASGKVIIAVIDRSKYSYGTYVVIDHGLYNGIKYSTLYGHCNSLAVKVGDLVKAGQVIAYIGTTGQSTGPHLHFEVREDSVQKDPQKYVKP